MTRKYKDADGELSVEATEDNEQIVVRFGSGYLNAGDRALRLRNNSNGWDVKQYSHSSAVAAQRFNLDYDTAEYLYLALSQIFRHGDPRNRVREIKD